MVDRMELERIVELVVLQMKEKAMEMGKMEKNKEPKEMVRLMKIKRKLQRGMVMEQRTTQ